MSETAPGPNVVTAPDTLGGGGPMVIGDAATSKVGFYGASPITQPTNANQAALTVTTGLTGGIGFTTTTGFSAALAQLENIRASLVLLGLLKGS